MKKLLTALVLTLALALALGIAACSSDKGGNGKFDDLDSTESVYGFSAASAGMIISSMNGGEAAALAASKGFAETFEDTSAENDEFAELDRYMALVESLLSDGGFGVTESASDREGYAHKMTISYRDIQGNTLQYVMHYNQTAIPDDDHDDDDDDDWFDFDDEREENYAIEGILTVEGTDYAVRGERSFETEGNESESETEFAVTLGEKRYMLVEQGQESEGSESEEEYSYSVYENRRLVERSAFSYETERGETELKMVSYKNGVSESFYFERETVRGEEVIRLRVGSGQNAQSYIVRTVTGENGETDYVYEPYSGRS